MALDCSVKNKLAARYVLNFTAYGILFHYVRVGKYYVCWEIVLGRNVEFTVLESFK